MLSDVGYFSTMHCDSTPVAQEAMFLVSIESFLRHNKQSKFHLVLLHKGTEPLVVPDLAHKLSSRYGGRFLCKSLPVPEASYGCKVLLYAYRFRKEVSDLIGTPRLVYMDLDLYHTGGIESDLQAWVNWSRISACLDSVGYGNNRRVLEHQNSTHRPYVNTGVVAWEASNRGVLDDMKLWCERAAKLSAAELAKNFPFHDQDVFNNLMAVVGPEELHIMPDMFNYHPRAFGNVFDLVRVALASSSAGAKVLHLMSYQPQRLEFFRVATETEGWYWESLAYGVTASSELRIVVISHNQAPSIPRMKAFLDRNFRGCPVVTVLDRCTDGSQGVADACGMPYVVNREGQGFLAGRMRDIGLQAAGAGFNMLFLDGDRIPGDAFNYSEALTALSLYDVTLLPVAEGEFRPWFRKDTFTPNPNYGKMDNHVFTCGIIVRKEAMKALKDKQGGLLFVKDFDGQFGEEDQYLGDVAYKLGLTCGGAPLSMALSGGFRPQGERSGFERNVAVRNRLRASLGFGMSGHLDAAGRASVRDKIRGSSHV